MLIQTKYLGPSNVRGSRIKAQLNGESDYIVMSYRSDLDPRDNHAAAKDALCAKLNIKHLDEATWVASAFKNGFIFIPKF